MRSLCLRPAPLALAACLALNALAAQAQAPAATPAPAPNVAATAALPVQIAAQPLAQALNDLARQARLELVVQPAQVQGRQAPAVQGTFTARQALDRLLAGTGLVAVIEGSLVTVQRDPAAGAFSGADKVLDEVRVAAEGVRNVATEGSGSYAPRAVDVGKQAQTLREIPQSVTVVTQQRMQDQGLRTLDDVMAQTTGITREETWLDTAYLSRGLAIGNVRYDGGGASTVSSSSRNEDMAQFDSVALLRGADGLFGAGDAGGVINLTYKRPQAKRKFQTLLSAGTRSNYRGEADLTGPLNDAGTLRARLVAVSHDQHQMAAPAKLRRQMVYGALEADLGPDTVVMLGASQQNDDNPGFNASLPRYSDGGDLGLPRSANMGAPWNFIRRDSTTVFARAEHQLPGDWLLKASLRHNRFKEAISAAEIEGAVDRATLAGAEWWIHQAATRKEETVLDTNAQGGFDAWGLRHDVIVGADMVRSNTLNRNLWPRIGTADVFNPVAPADPGYPLSGWTAGSTGVEQKMGVYGSVRLRPIERWAVVLGGRYTVKDRKRSYNRFEALTSDRDEGNVLVPYLGLVHELSRTTSLYASTAEIFESQATKLSAPLPGTPLEPIRGRNYELGIKGDLAQGRMQGSFALYRVEKKGQAVTDPSYPSSTSANGLSCCYFTDGYLLSQGFEAELNGEAAPGLQLSLGYTFNANENKRTSDTQFSTVTPRHVLKAWANYKLQGDLRGWSLGAGVVAQSKHYRSGVVNRYNPATGQYDGESLPFKFTAAGHAIWSMRAEYAFNKDWRLAVNVNNLFDKTYYSTVGYSGYGNFYGDARSVVVSLSSSF